MTREIPSKKEPLIMGILNVTPDSFFDGGKHNTEEAAIEYALQMVEDGADIIDVGGESTRPYAEEVDLDEELKRVIPVIEKISARSDVFISIDTYKSKVAQEACLAGAHMINDISGLTFDPQMSQIAGQLRAYVVIMHTRGTPKNMQENPYYKNVVAEIKKFFLKQMEAAIQAGIAEDRIILDPGIGFGKRVEDNLKILKMLGEFKKLGRPLLIGTSMKSFIGKVTESPLEERLEGTLASLAVSLMNGADILRVHDVKSAQKVAKLVHAVMES
ncbi:MAG: dihydropteroate synthase [Syntrophus sp. (in: bacteria)]|nr:dihydropteroate synthase [Syntrophus sp. (in: bacteria)]